jgi:predicted nucleic acid-binding protein
VIVLDASAVIELLLHTEPGDAVAARIAPAAESLHGPHLLSVEVSQVLRRFVAAGTIGDDSGAIALADLAQIDIERYDHEPLLPRMWELRANLTMYDAAYVALAEVLDAPLLTFDRRLADSPGHRAAIELLA